MPKDGKSYSSMTTCTLCLFVYLFIYLFFAELESCKDLRTILNMIKEILASSNVILADKMKALDVRKISLLMWAGSNLSRSDIEHIKHEVTTSDKVEKLLDILHGKPKEAYYSFLDALYDKRPDLYSAVRKIQKEHVKGENCVCT